MANSSPKVFIREHFSREIEANIKILLAIRRAALDKKLKVTLNADRLVINSQRYTVETLHLLPDNLKPENIAVKVQEDHLFFFSKQTPLSNFSPAEFTIADTKYSFSEQYIQQQKAILFNAADIAKKVMAAKSPGEMKKLTSKLPNFNIKTWEEKVPEIAYTALKNKFSQNPSPLQICSNLLKTKSLWRHPHMISYGA